MNLNIGDIVFFNYYDDFYCAEIDGRIVSICRKTRNEERICSISYVYTDKAYRGRGLAKMVVGKLTNDIVGSNKIAYLYAIFFFITITHSCFFITTSITIANFNLS